MEKTLKNQQNAIIVTQICCGGQYRSQLFHQVCRRYDYRGVSTSVLKMLEDGGDGAWMFPPHTPPHNFYHLRSTRLLALPLECL